MPFGRWRVAVKRMAMGGTASCEPPAASRERLLDGVVFPMVNEAVGEGLWLVL